MFTFVVFGLVFLVINMWLDWRGWTTMKWRILSFLCWVGRKTEYKEYKEGRLIMWSSNNNISTTESVPDSFNPVPVDRYHLVLLHSQKNSHFTLPWTTNNQPGLYIVLAVVINTTMCDGFILVPTHRSLSGMLPLDHCNLDEDYSISQDKEICTRSIKMEAH